MSGFSANCKSNEDAIVKDYKEANSRVQYINDQRNDYFPLYKTKALDCQAQSYYSIPNEARRRIDAALGLLKFKKSTYWR